MSCLALMAAVALPVILAVLIAALTAPSYPANRELVHRAT
jgi:hypothetical protein